MPVLKNLLGAVTATLLLSAAIPTTASAVMIFNFSGQCDDCASVGGAPLSPNTNMNDGAFQAVSGTLVLSDTIYILGEDDRPTEGNPAPGISISLGNFMSFTYNGSNLLNPFTVFGQASVPLANTDEVAPNNGLPSHFSALSVTGVLDPLGNVLSSFDLFFGSSNGNTIGTDAETHGPTDLTCGQNPFRDACEVFVGTNGFWSIGIPIDDVGNSGTFATTATIAEPGTLAILGLGLAGLGLARRKRA